jgi:hypothetical protein
MSADCVVGRHNPALLEIIAHAIVPCWRNISFLLAIMSSGIIGQELIWHHRCSYSQCDALARQTASRERPQR